jgi:hypothetical protein
MADFRENLLTWNGPNWLTVGLMSLTFGAAVGFGLALLVRFTK